MQTIINWNEVNMDKKDTYPKVGNRILYFSSTSNRAHLAEVYENTNGGLSVNSGYNIDNITDGFLWYMLDDIRR